MKLVKKLLDRIFFALQWPIAKSKFLSKAYLLSCGSLLRIMGENYITQRVINHIAKNSWPELKFSKRAVFLCENATVNIVPHVGEFDFRALFSKSLAYETHLFSWLLLKIKNFSAIVEIGANVGVFSVFFSKYGNGIPVYSFEPSKKAFFRLLANLEANDNTTVNPINSAVSEKTGFITFFEPVGHLTNGSLDKEFASIFSDTVKANIVPTISGADILTLVENTAAVLLKIDVEGAEPRVLRSLEQFIREKKPVIIIEVLETVAAELNSFEFITELYRIYLMTERGLIQKTTFESDATYRDYCLIPHDSLI